MDREIVENIDKVPFLHTKLGKINALLEEKKIVESYKAVAALIEMTCIITIEKIYEEKIEDSNIIILASIFDKYHENEIKECLVDINGDYNHIQLNKASQTDVMGLLGNLDDLVEIIIRKYGNIF